MDEKGRERLSLGVSDSNLMPDHLSLGLPDSNVSPGRCKTSNPRPKHLSFESGGNDGKETQEKRSRREESRWKKKKRSRRGEPEEDKKYMRIRREAAGQGKGERTELD